MNKVFLDTHLWIYLVEDPGSRGLRAMQIVSAISGRGDSLIVSTLTLGELLVKPLRMGDQALADRYRRAFHVPGVKLSYFDEAGGEFLHASGRTRALDLRTLSNWRQPQRKAAISSSPMTSD